MKIDDPLWLLYTLPVVGLGLIVLAGSAATIVAKALEHINKKGDQ